MKLQALRCLITGPLTQRFSLSGGTVEATYLWDCGCIAGVLDDDELAIEACSQPRTAFCAPPDLIKRIERMHTIVA